MEIKLQTFISGNDISVSEMVIEVFKKLAIAKCAVSSKNMKKT